MSITDQIISKRPESRTEAFLERDDEKLGGISRMSNAALGVA